MAKYRRGGKYRNLVNRQLSKRTLKDYNPPYIRVQQTTGYSPPGFTSNTGGAGCQCGSPQVCSLTCASGNAFRLMFEMTTGTNAYSGWSNSTTVNWYDHGVYDWFEENKVAYRVYMSPSGNCTSGNYCGDTYQTLIYSGTMLTGVYGYDQYLTAPAIAMSSKGQEYLVYFNGPSGGTNTAQVSQYTGGTTNAWGKAGWYKVEIDGPGGSVKGPWVALYTYKDNTTSYECDCSPGGCSCDPGGYTQTEACCCFDCSGDGITCCDDPPGNPVSNCCRGECSPGDPGYACGYDYSCDPPNTENCSPGGCDTCYTYCYVNCTDVKGVCT